MAQLDKEEDKWFEKLKDRFLLTHGGKHDVDQHILKTTQADDECSMFSDDVRGELEK